MTQQNRQDDKNRQTTNQNSGNQGFASMDADRQQDIASAGGKAAHATGNAHEFSSDEAREVGHKGGSVSQRSGTGYESDTDTRNASSGKDQQSTQTEKNAPSNKRDGSY